MSDGKENGLAGEIANVRHCLSLKPSIEAFIKLRCALSKIPEDIADGYIEQAEEIYTYRVFNTDKGSVFVNGDLTLSRDYFRNPCIFSVEREGIRTFLSFLGPFIIFAKGGEKITFVVFEILGKEEIETEEGK